MYAVGTEIEFFCAQGLTLVGPKTSECSPISFDFEDLPNCFPSKLSYQSICILLYKQRNTKNPASKSIAIVFKSKKRLYS